MWTEMKPTKETRRAQAKACHTFDDVGWAGETRSHPTRPDETDTRSIIVEVTQGASPDRQSSVCTFRESGYTLRFSASPDRTVTTLRVAQSAVVLVRSTELNLA